jgi:hypothetical protein
MKKTALAVSILVVALTFLFMVVPTRNSPAVSLGGEETNEPSPPPGDEYPVAYWAQTHIQLALLLQRKSTPATLESACRTGLYPSEPSLKKAWNSFRSPKRLSFCRKYPVQTLHLFGEAPYFMLRPPGSQR